MEEEILLASDGFYYQGTPSQSTYSATTKKTEGYSALDDTEYVFTKIESTLVISQIVVVTLAVICIIKGLLNSKNNKKITSSESDLSGETSEENMHQKATVPYYALSVVLFITYGIINIVKSFVENVK